MVIFVKADNIKIIISLKGHVIKWYTYKAWDLAT